MQFSIVFAIGWPKNQVRRRWEAPVFVLWDGEMFKPLRIALGPFAVGLFAVLAPGCSEDFGDRLEVSGSVSLKGEPVDDGVIVFSPLAEGSAAATQSGAPITKGAYKVSREDGLLPGKYRVMITAGDGRTPAGDPDALPGPTGANIVSKDRIPPEYNTASKQEVEVKSGQPNVFNYDIP